MDCPGVEGDCQHRTCENGKCGLDLPAAGTTAATQTAHDCKKNQCNGKGAVETVADDTDIPDDDNPCTEDLCTDGVTSHVPMAAGTVCGTSLVCDGANACVGCVMASDCPGQDTECKTRKCTAGSCGFNFTATGTAVAAQTPRDCKKSQCDGNGNIAAVNDDTDLPVDNKTCTNDVCSGGTPSNPPVSAGTPCNQDNGTVCNALGACVQCVTAATCPGQDTACKTRTCVAGMCGTTFATVGTPAGTPVAGDCKKSQCDGSGNLVNVADDTDIPEDGNACTNDLCNSGTPSHTFSLAGTPCAAGTATCNGAGECSGCVTSTDCPGTDTECRARACVMGQCSFTYTPVGTAAGTQTSGDCHQGQCDGAGNIVSAVDDADVPNDGKECTIDSCTNGVVGHVNLAAGTFCTQGGGTKCDASGNCTTCTDGIQNGTETGVDCGGSCPSCGPVVISTSPADGATSVAVSSTIGITFSAAMKTSTLTYQTTAGACTGSVQVSANGFTSCIGIASAAFSGGNTVITLTPSAALTAATTYKIRVTTAAQSSDSKPTAAYDSSTGFTTTSASCAGAVVISQVYGGGGNSGATLTNDYVELHNRGGATVSVAGWSVQYASASGNTWSTTALTGSIAAGKFYLVKLATGGAVGSALPTADATGTSNMSASTGKVALVSSTTALTSACPSGGNLVDLVGYGSPSCSEGSSAAPGGSNTAAMLRAANGCTDTNVNGSDFATGTPNPRNSSSAAVSCTCSP
ncbi:hypothetical protein A7982_12781 [Minicystis rosea]|nr:hypothetical protein A7982_12781 [Minicystis rosea]